MTVHLESSTRTAAVLKIYRDQTRGAGEALTGHELRCAWARTGLRREDLQVALGELREHGLLVRRQADDDSRYELTEEGAAVIAHPHGNFLTRVVDWWFLE